MTRSHSVRAFDAADEQICSQPLTASLVANRKSQPPVFGGGATRSLRFGTRPLSRPGPQPERLRRRSRRVGDERASDLRGSLRSRATHGATGERSEIVDVCGGDERLGQLARELTAVSLRQEPRPCEHLDNRISHRAMVVHRQKTLGVIADLKKVYGMGWDVHASRGFEEPEPPA